MENNLAVIGGDLRIVKLVEMLANEGKTVYVTGLEKAENLKNIDNVIFCETISKTVENSKIVIGPVPFTTNAKDVNTPFSDNQITIQELLSNINSKTLIAGAFAENLYEIASSQNIKLIDLMKREELAVLNTIATAEGAIELAISNTNKILHGSEVLILGFGRVGKVLARKLSGMEANVTCAARKDEDLAWIKAYGYNLTNINTLGENLSKYDIIINTVPHMILDEKRLQYVNKECLLIDLASNPGGIDKKIVKEKNLKFVWALALPGKVAPITSAEFIKDTVNNILKDISNI